MTEFYGVLQRSIFVLNSRLMFSDIKSDIGTSTGYMTEEMELLGMIEISIEMGEGLNFCIPAHIFIISSR